MTVSMGSREKLLGLFFQEVEDYISPIEQNIHLVEAGDGIEGALAELHRLFHNIKGAASQLSLNYLSKAACVVELLLEDLVDHSRAYSPDVAQFLKETTLAIGDYCRKGVRHDERELQLFQDAAKTCGKIVESLDSEQFETICSYLESESIIDHQIDFVVERQEKSTMLGKNENQETIRSIIKLLGQLNSFCLQQNIPDVAGEAIGEIHNAVKALQDCVSDSGRDDQRTFLKALDELLIKVSKSKLLGSQEIPGLLGDFLTCLEMLFVSPDSLKSHVVNSIVEKMQRVGELLEPAADEEISSDIDELFEPELPDSPQDDLIDDLFGADDDIFDQAGDDLFSEPLEDPIADESLTPDTSLDDNSFDLDSVFDSPDDIAEEVSSPFEENVFLEAEEEETDEYDDEEEFSLEEVFKAECEEHMLVISHFLHALEQSDMSDNAISSSQREALREMRRAVHTLKGAAAMTGFSYLSEFAHNLEDLLDHLFEKAAGFASVAVDLLISGITTLEELSNTPGADKHANVAGLRENINAFLGQVDSSGKAEEVAVIAEIEDVVTEDAEIVEAPTPLPAVTDNVRVRLESLDELANLEGDLVIARNAMNGMLDELNLATSELEAAKDKLRKVSEDLETGFEVQGLQGFGLGGAKSETSDNEAAEAQGSEFDAMELDRYSELNLIIRSLNEMSVDVGSIHTEIAQLSGDLKGQIAIQEITMRMMQDRLMRIRMTPLSEITRVFFRAVRDTASKLNKKVKLSVEGEDVYLDRFIWSKVTDPIMHIIRNCIDHGIESSERRNDLEKPETATITIDATQQGSMVVLRIGDDGAGVNVAKLEKNLIESGVINPVHGLSERELLAYLFETGVSTKDEISQISGRGVGLDVVKKNIQDLKGSVHLHTVSGAGATFEINIPISLSVNRAVIVYADDFQYAVPLHDIVEIKGAAQDENENTDAMNWRGKVIAKRYLSDIVGNQSAKRDDSIKEHRLAIIVASEDKHVAVVVDTITGQQEIVVKSLGSHLKYVHGVSGVTDFGDGNLVPILNLPELASEKPVKTKSGMLLDTTPRVHSKTHVLVVDDSISVRQSVVRLLKRQNWIIEAAKDGVDALEKLENFAPDVIISDIEMPRMNGYEFKEALNMNSAYDSVPVIMLTSRISDKHKQKAQELGVDRYLIKPYKEDEFVQLVSDLSQKKNEEKN